MTAQSFRELLKKSPFLRFRILMSSGESYEVLHPERTLLTRADIVVGIGASRHGVPATFKICSLLHITAVEPLSPSVP
jgi:hypothetical protein